MSLLKKASIITTPTAYAEDYLYSIKPAYALGSELITNGDFATDSDWSKGSGVTISNGKAVFTNVSNATQGLVQSNVAVIGKTYKITFTISDYNQGAVYVLRPTNLGAGSAVSSNGTFTFTLKAETSSSFILFTVGTTTLSIDNVSVKEITDADFDFDRNSTGTRVNEDYLIEDVPYNLFVQSNQFDTTWFNSNSTDTSGQAGYNYSNDAWRIDITGAAGYISQSLAQSGLQTASVFVKAGTLNFVRCRVTGTGGNKFVDVNLTNGAIGTTGADNINATSTNIGQGWYRITLTYNATLSAFLIYPIQADSDFTATSGNIYIQNAQLVKGDQPKEYLKTTDRLDIPRIDYTNGEPSILLEPSRTNSVTYNSQLDDASYTSANLTISANQINSPEGISNADKLTETTANGIHYIGKNITSPSAGTYTFSGFLKKGTSNYAGIRAVTNGFTNRFFANLDLTTGEITSTNTVGSGITWSYGVEEYSNGWFRLYITGTHSTGNLDISFGLSNSASPSYSLGFPTYTGSTSNFVYAYGFQVEAGSYATSIIHTSGSAVTRSADAANNAGNSDLFNDSEGVLYAEISSLSLSGGDGYISITDGTASNRITLRNTSTLNNVVSQCVVGGVNQASMDFILQDRTLKNKIAFRYKANDFSLYVNGQEVLIDTSGTVPSGLKELSFNNGAGVGQWYGNAKMVAVFKEALTDLELEKLTGYNNHELYMNYYNRLSYLGLAEEYNVESDINNYIL